MKFEQETSFGATDLENSFIYNLTLKKLYVKMVFPNVASNSLPPILKH
jgi:hypothetical protein